MKESSEFNKEMNKCNNYTRLRQIRRDSRAVRRPAVSVPAALAGRFPLSGLRLWKVVAFAKSAAAVRCVWAPNLGDRRDGHAQPFAVVVSCDVTKKPEPALWDFKECWGSTGTKRLGPGCTKCGARWCGRDGICSPGQSKSMKATGAGSKRTCGAETCKALIAVAAQEAHYEDASGESLLPFVEECESGSVVHTGPGYWVEKGRLRPSAQLSFRN